MTVTAPSVRLGVEKLEDRTTPSTFASGAGQFGGWAMNIGESAGRVEPLASTADAVGNLYIVGTLFGSADFDPSSGVTRLTSVGGHDFFTAKYDAAGALVWAHVVRTDSGGTLLEPKPSDIAADASGNVYVSGSYDSGSNLNFTPGFATGILPTPFNSDAYVVKLNEDGEFVWAHTVPSADAFAAAVCVAPDGRVFSAGLYNDVASFDPTAPSAVIQTTAGNAAGYVIEHNPSTGRLAGTRFTKLGGTAQDGDVFIRDAVAAAGGVVYVGGQYFTQAVTLGETLLNLRGQNNAFLAEVRANGEVGWANRLASTGSDEVSRVALDAAGGLYAGGSFGGQTVGWTALTHPGQQVDAFVSRFTAGGTHVWSREWGGSGSENLSGLGVSGGQVFTVGRFEDAVRIGPAGRTPLTSKGSTDVYAAQWKAEDGTFVADGQIGGTGGDAAIGAGVSGFGRVYAVGLFSETADLDPTAGGEKKFTAENSGGDLFLSKFRLTPRVDLYATSPGPGASPQVKVFNADGTLRYDFFAYEEFFTGGVSVATGDLNGDGIDDIITGAMASGGPRVRVFDGASPGTVPNQVPGPFGSFFAFESFFGGGVSVGVGDVNGDGVIDLVTAAGPSGGPRVRVFDGRSLTGAEPAQVGGPLGSFFAFEPFFTGGVSLAVGDVTGDGRTDLVTSAGPSGGPRVRVFDARSTGDLPAQVPGTLGSFFALPQSFTGGITVAIGEITGDGVGDFIIGQASQGSRVRVIDSATVTSEPVSPLYDFEALDGSLLGARVAASDLDDDGQAEVLVGEGPGGRPRLRAFRPDGTRITTLAELPYDAALGTGIFVG